MVGYCEFTDGLRERKTQKLLLVAGILTQDAGAGRASLLVPTPPWIAPRYQCQCLLYLSLGLAAG